MLNRIAHLNFFLTILCLLILCISSVQAIPVADEPICEDDAQNCSGQGAAKNKKDAAIAGNDSDNSLPQDVFELLGAQFANKDVVKLFDRKTAEILNTAVYPMALGKGLVESYISKAYTTNAEDVISTASNKWSNDGVEKSREFGGNKNRAWAGDSPGYDRRDRAHSKPGAKDSKEETNWIAKTASILEYAAVLLICGLFWVWFRQSKNL